MPKKNKKVKNRAVKTKEIQTTLCENLIDVGKSNYKSWIYLKDKLNFKRDVEFVEYLLSVAEKYLCSKLIHYGDKRQKYSNDVEDKGGKPGGNCQDNKKMDEDNEMDDETEIEEDDDEEIEIINTDTVEENKLINCDILGSKNSKRKNISAQSTINTKEDKSFRGEKMKKIINENESEKTEKKCVLALDSCPYCDVKHIEESCPLRCAQLIIADQTSSYSSDQEDFATTTLPDCLELQDLENGGETKRVVARQDIKRFTQFGPLIGERIKEMEIADDCSMKHIWQVQDGVYLTTTSTLTSNWLRWIRPAPVRTDRNIVPIEKNGQLYFSTCSDITSGDELFYWAEMRGAWASKKMEKTNCGGCNLQFEHAMYYRMHCAVFHEASLSLTVRKYHCKVCGKAVLGKQNIMKHALLYHEGKGAYQCQFCSKYFLRLNYLEMHRNYGCSANPHRARPLCDYCGRKFCQPQKLKVHIKRMHSDLAEVLQEFQCRDCLKVLGSRAALQRHTKEVHRRPSGVSCAKCSKTFQNKSNLKIHMLTHSGVKPFKCQEERCSAAFTTKQCLQFHYKKVHGLTEDKFPRIERSVEYTFESYSGGNENQIGDTSSSSLSDCGGGGEEPRPPLLRGEETSVIEYHRSAPPPPPPQPPPAPQKTWTDIEVSTAYNSETVVEHEARRSPSPKPYDYTRPQSTSPPPPSIGPPPSGYVSPSRYESGGHYLTPLSPLRYRSDEEVAQNLTKYKYDDNRSAVYHELIPRYPLYEYAWDVLRPPPPPAPPPPPTSSSSQSIDLTVGGHLVGPTIIHERPPSPQTNYQSAVFHVQHKSPVYHHFSGYY